MIRLEVYPQSGSGGTVLDLSNEATVSLSFAVAEASDVTSRNSPFSQTFRLPQSENNNLFFEHWYMTDISTTEFDVRVKVRCALYEDGVFVLGGYLQLREAYLVDGSYTVGVYGDAANLYQGIGDSVLRDAFIFNGIVSTNYDYDQTSANVVNSWDTTNDITIGTVGDGTIIVPIIDWGSGGPEPLMFDSGLLDYGLAGSGNISSTRFKPCIKLKALFDLILARQNYTYTSTFLNSSDFTNIYMQLGTEQDNIFRNNYGFRAQPSTSQTLTIGSSVTVNFGNDSTGGNYDQDAVFNTGTSIATLGTANQFQTLTGKVVLNISNPDAADAIVVVDVTSSEGFQTTTVIIPAGGDSVALIDVQIPIDGVDTLEVTAEQINNGNTTACDIETTSSTTDSFFTIYPYPGQSVSVPGIMPDIKQSEFLKDIIQRFNLILEASPDNERHLVIEPWQDWVAAGNKVDWTNKVDLEKQVLKKPTTEFKKSVIEFSDVEGKDDPNQIRQEDNGYVFGRYREIVDDDFAQGELKNNAVFKPFHVHEVPSLTGTTQVPNMVIAREYEFDEGNRVRVSNAPSIFYYHGLTAVGDTIYIGTTSSTDYPLCTAFNESPTTADTKSLYWAYQWPYGFGTPPIGTQYVHRGLYETYWKSYLDNIYARDAHILEAHFWLTPSDILNLRFNDLIMYKNTGYRINKIEGYVVGGYETTKVQLISDQSGASRPCDYIPVEFQPNGIIVFGEADDITTTETNVGQACCEAYDGTWDSTATVCRWSAADFEPLTEDPTDLYQNDVYPVISSRPIIGGRVDLQRVVLTAQSVNGSTVVATDARGLSINIPPNVVMKIRVGSTSVQVNAGTGGALGNSSYREYVFVAKNINGTISVLSKGVTGSTIEDAVTTRTVSIGSSGRVVQLSVTGESYCTTSFALDCEVETLNISEER